MNKIIKKLRWIYMTLLGWIIITVPIDTYILGGKIKLWIIAKANTTSASPYSTDGQMNIIIVIISICGLIIGGTYLFGWFREDETDDDDDEEETTITEVD